MVCKMIIKCSNNHNYDTRMAKRMGGMQRSFTMIGTPDYLPPEQVRGQGHGLGADYWGLGVLL